MKSIRQVKRLKGKKVLLRIDGNVPLVSSRGSYRVAPHGDTRLSSVIPTINFLRKKGARIIIATHLGRPGGKRIKKLSVKPIAKWFEKKLKQKIDVVDYNNVGELENGDVLLLENLRYNKGENKNDASFAKDLSQIADIYVNDAFGVCHRKAASVVAITRYLPSYAGLNLEREVLVLHKVMTQPKQPLVVVLGGVKVDTKIPVIKKLLSQSDAILLGGMMANQFYAVSTHRMRGLECSRETIKQIKKLSDNSKIYLPHDVVVRSRGLRGKGQIKDLSFNSPADADIMDIGPKATHEYSDIIKNAGTVIWNGPVGLFEDVRFKKGTMALARSISRSSSYSVVGGGETLQATIQAGVSKKINHLSTGGGAMLTFLSGKKLPGLKALGYRK